MHLDRHAMLQHSPLHSGTLHPSTGTPTHNTYLPDEILLLILTEISDASAQATFHATSLVNRQWHVLATPFLYASPRLAGPNFALFVRTVCPSVNAHIRRSDLAGHVRRLDLRRLVHESSKSVTARLLGRTKDSLEAFAAPQASFAINCFAALGKCARLRELDLSLVCEAVPLRLLAVALRDLRSLRVLRVPRAAKLEWATVGSAPGPPEVYGQQFLRRLEELHLSGGMVTEPLFMPQPAHARTTVTTLAITNAPYVTEELLMGLLRAFGDVLRNLALHTLPLLRQGALDYMLRYAPRVEKLHLETDFITHNLPSAMMVRSIDPWDPSKPPSAERKADDWELPLRELRLRSSGGRMALGPTDIRDAVCIRDLPMLRRVVVDSSIRLWYRGVGSLSYAMLMQDIKNWRDGKGCWGGKKRRHVPRQMDAETENEIENAIEFGSLNSQEKAQNHSCQPILDSVYKFYLEDFSAFEWYPIYDEGGRYEPYAPNVQVQQDERRKLFVQFPHENLHLDDVHW